MGIFGWIGEKVETAIDNAFGANKSSSSEKSNASDGSSSDQKTENGLSSSGEKLIILRESKHDDAGNTYRLDKYETEKGSQTHIHTWSTVENGVQGDVGSIVTTRTEGGETTHTKT